MNGLLRTSKILFITAAGLINFIYTTISTFIVFSYIFEKTGLFKNKFAFPDSAMFQPPVHGDLIAASFSPALQMLLYLFLLILGFTAAVMFLYSLIEIPKYIALFYMHRLDGFLFIDRKKTITFFIMLLLPIINYITNSLSGWGQSGTGIVISMILCTITHSGVLVLISLLNPFRDSAVEAGEKFRFLKISTVFFVRVAMVLIASIYIVPPYLLYYHFNPDIPSAGVFHFFLITGIVSNYRFYRENFIDIIEESGDVEED